MPPVVVGVVVAAVAYTAATITVITAIAIGMAAAALYSVATMDIPSMAGTDPQNAKQTIRSANEPLRGVYGLYMGSGPIVYAEEYLHKSGYNETYTVCRWSGHKDDRKRVCTDRTRWVDTSVKWLHIVVPVAGHVVDDVLEVYFGDELQTNWDASYWKINFMDGTQTSISDLPPLLTAVPSWTSDMIGKGVAFVHVALRHSTKYFPNGIPNIKALIRGAKVSTPFVTGYSNNAAAVIYDYLVKHFKVKPESINSENFTNEYAICGEVMDGEVHNGTQQIRYAINGGFDYDETHNQIMKKMLSACGGRLNFIHGQYYLEVAAYRGPVPSDQIVELGDISGAVTITADTPLSDRVNTVTGQFLDPERGYQLVDFDEVSNPDYVEEDGEVRTLDMDLEFVISPYQANRLAKIALKDNRYGLTLEVPMNWRGFKFNTGLPAGFNDPALGYDQLEFRIATWSFSPKSGPKITLKQTAPEIYDDSVATVSPKPTPPEGTDPRFCYPVENLEFYAFPEDGVYDGVVLWSHPEIENVRKFEIVVTSSSGEVLRYSTLGDMELRLSNMQGISYTITVTAYNLNGAPSDPVAISEVIGSVNSIASVVFFPTNFDVTIAPVPSGLASSSLKYLFFRAQVGESPPTQVNMEYIGEGTTFTDVGRKPNTTYNYFIQPVSNSSAAEVSGPYSTTTTDDPTDLIDVIGDEIPGQFTWRVWAEDAFGTGISLTYEPATHKFEGLAYNKATETPSTNPLDYTFIRIADYISDEEQTILDNLAQGKLPDGSGNLISEDDVLFKPGDKVQETNIADDAISTPKIQANAVVADTIAANAITSPKISAGAITAEKLAAESVTAGKLAANSVSANSIQSGAITTDKLAVTVVSPLNNFSQFNDLRGWTFSETPIGMVEEVPLEGNNVLTLKVMSGTSDKTAISDKFPLDTGAVYEVRASLYNAQTADNVEQGFTVKFYNASNQLVAVDTYHPETSDFIDNTTTPELWRGYAQGWRHMKAYVVTGTTDIESTPKSANVDIVIKAPTSAAKCEVILSSFASSVSNACHFYSPSVVKLGSGVLVANEIKAGTSITAPIINGGVINGATGNFAGDVKAGRVVGAVGVAAAAEFGYYGMLPFDASYANNPNLTEIFEIIIRREAFARRIALTVDINLASITGNYSYCLNNHIGSLSYYYDTTLFGIYGEDYIPAGETLKYSIYQTHIPPIRIGYNSVNATTYMHPFSLSTVIDCPAFEEGDDTVDHIPIHFMFRLNQSAPGEWHGFLGGSATIQVVKETEDLGLNVFI